MEELLMKDQFHALVRNIYQVTRIALFPLLVYEKKTCMAIGELPL